MDLEAKSRELLDALEDKARQIGLYLEQGGVVPPPGFEGDGTPPVLAVVCDFVIGDVAWSKRVQDPEQHAFDKDFKAIQDDVEQDDLSAMEQRLLEQRRKLRGEE